MKWNEVTWYSRLCAILFFVGVLPTLTFYMGMKFQEVLNVTPPGNSLQINVPQIAWEAEKSLDNATTSTLIEVESIPTCESCLPFLDSSYFEGSTSWSDEYKDPISERVVSFKQTDDKLKNPRYTVYVDDKRVGETSGEQIARASFSPDHKYFSFRTLSVSGCAAKCLNHDVYVVDIENAKVMHLLINRDVKEFDLPGKFWSVENFVESTEWEEEKILLIAYPIGVRLDTQYRIAPKELRSFDLKDPQEIMNNGEIVELLPE